MVENIFDEPKSLYKAAVYQQWDLVYALLTHPNAATLDLNTCPSEGPYRGRTALWLAVRYKQMEIVRLLRTHQLTATLDPMQTDAIQIYNTQF